MQIHCGLVFFPSALIFFPLIFSTMRGSQTQMGKKTSRPFQLWLFYLPLIFLSIKGRGLALSLVYLLISVIFLSLSHPLCCRGLGIALIPYQSSSHLSPCCLSCQVHHPPICLQLPMLRNDLLAQPHWRVAGGKGNNRAVGN